MAPLLPEYPAVLLSAGRYLAFGLIALPLAWLDRAQLARLQRAGWIELAKRAEVLFIEVLRQYIGTQSAGRTGWLAGVGDRVVGAALNELHARPAHTWTLEQVARVVGTSRSVLAERFQHLVGSPPMQYVTQWRMLLAANLLAGSTGPLARIAEEVGYQTDTAFIRAFRREYGAPPAAWRRNRAARDEAR